MKFVILALMIIMINSQNSTAFLQPLATNSNGEAQLTCVGNAQQSLNANLVNIIIDIQTNNMSASDALSNNNQIQSQVSQDITNLGIPSANISTVSYSINPSYISVYNNVTNSYDSVFNGFIVDNQLQIQTSNLNLVGSVIDAAVNDGATIQNVNWSADPNSIQQANYNLIPSAITDCQNQAKQVLKAINYKSQSYLSLSIQDMQSSVSTPSVNNLVMAASSSTNLYPGKIIIRIKIIIIIIIK